MFKHYTVHVCGLIENSAVCYCGPGFDLQTSLKEVLTFVMLGSSVYGRLRLLKSDVLGEKKRGYSRLL